MADLLIKGMEMPIDCFHCAFDFDNDCVADNDNRTTNLNGRPGWCPLVEMPTHGRLIDADKVALEMVEAGQRSKRYKIGEFWELNGAEIREVIDAAPTVIEASEAQP